MEGTNQNSHRRRRRLKSPTERLLQDGRIVDDPTADERAELRRLEKDLGLVEVSWRKYFLCVDHGDDEDLVHAWNRACDNRIELAATADEGGDPIQLEDDLKYVCPGCGRVHWPTRRQRTLYDRAVVTMPDHLIDAFFEGRVREIAPDAERLDDLPVFRLRLDGREAYACLLDLCTESRFATRSFASTNAMVYVTAASRVLSDRWPDGDDWLSPLPLHELASEGNAALLRRLQARITAPLPAMLRDAPVRAYLPLRNPAPRVVRERIGIHDLVIGKASITLDGVEVLSSRARMQVAVIKELAARRIEDLRDGRTADDCRWIHNKTLLDKLGDATKTDEAETIGKHLNRARSDMASRYEEQTGIPLEANEIIESTPKGYRLNPARVSIRYA